VPLGYVATDAFAKMPLVVGDNISVNRADSDGNPTPEESCKDNGMVWMFNKCLSKEQVEQGKKEMSLGAMGIMVATGMVAIFIAGFIKDGWNKRRK